MYDQFHPHLLYLCTEPSVLQYVIRKRKNLNYKIENNRIFHNFFSYQIQQYI
jgi:hypothetical protein